MSNIARMMQQATAGAAGAGLDVDEVFSTHLYDGGVSTPLTINNGIDLSGKGGLVWIKNRSSAVWHQLADTARGANKMLSSNSSNSEVSRTEHVKSFTSTGFTIGNDNDVNYDVIGGSQDDQHVSWTFRKAPKFFDVVTYSGSSSAQTIAHNLGVTPAMIIVKQLNSSGRWTVYHKDASPTDNPENGRVSLNTTDQWYEYPSISSFANLWNQTAPTSTHFTVGTDATTGANGSTYVAYLFAHNNNDGEFGPSSDQDIIKCDKYTGGTTGTEVNVGFEPQFVMIKRTTGSGDWMVFDAMRGVVSDPYENLDNTLFWNHTRVERTNTGYIGFTPTGFIHQGGSGDTNTTSDNYIYMAIRRGPLAVPTDATKVFGIDTAHSDNNNTVSGDMFTAGFPVDMGIYAQRSSSSFPNIISARSIQGSSVYTNASDAVNTSSEFSFDHQTGWSSGSTTITTDKISWMWRRAPKYFDIVNYDSTGSNLTLNHNLGVVPEMMWVKVKNASVVWAVYHKNLDSSAPEDYAVELDSTGARFSASGYWNNTAPTSSVFTVGTAAGTNGHSSYRYIAYLFATLAGVSKVGSYTGTGNTQTIDCGFTNGARFVLVKNTTSSGFSSTQRNWLVFDSARGIVSGNDPYLYLNANNSEQTGSDFIDPHSSGFQLTNAGGNDANGNGGTYIFYAIA